MNIGGTNVQNIGGGGGGQVGGANFSLAGCKLIGVPVPNQCLIITFLTSKTDNIGNQLLQLCTARTASVIRSETSLITESDRSGPIR